MFELLTRNEVYAIHMAAMEVLERTGILIQHEEALRILKDAGATIDQKKKVAHIPEYLVKEAVRKTPSRHLFRAINPKFNILIGDGNSYFTNAFGAQCTYDFSTGQRRASTLKDLEDFTLLSDYFPAVDYIKPNIIPQEVPQDTLQQTMALSMFKNSEKHLSFLALTLEGFKDVIEMAKLYAGGEEEFLRHPSIIDTGLNNVPPLKYTANIIDIALECAKYKIPFDISTGALASASGPITLAGMVVQGVAENHAVLVLTELVGPGTPMIWGSCATIMDQRHGTAAYGSPENGLIHAAFCQVAHYYGIPYYGAAGIIDSKVPDAQAAYENTMNVLNATLAGVDVVHDAVYGIVETGITASYEMFAISNEICEAVKRIARGMKVSKETLAVDLIDKVGHDSNYLTSDEGLEFTRKHLLEEYWIPSLTDRTSRPDWEAKGSKDMLQRAREKVKKILDTHKVAPLGKDVEEKMRNIIKQRAKKRP